MIRVQRSTLYFPKNGPTSSGLSHPCSYPKRSASTSSSSSDGQPDDEVTSASPWSVPLPNKAKAPRSNSQQITPTIPEGANPDHYILIQAPRRRVIINESTVTLRKNKTYCALVEGSYVKLDWVWEVPLAILSVVPRAGMQLMLRAVSMEKIMGFYSGWGWDQAWGQRYRSRPEPLHGIRQGGEAAYLELKRHSCKPSNGLASPGLVEQDEGLAEPNSIGSWDLACGPDSGKDGHLEPETPRARQEMVYAGEAHCALLARLLRECQWRSPSKTSRYT